MDGNETGARKLIIGIIIVVVIAVIAAIWLSVRGPEDGNPAAVGQAFDREEAVQAGRTATVTVGDQFPGGIVYVSQVDLPQGGWVVVRKDEAGQPGAVIGAGYFNADTRVGNVELIESTVEGQRYHVELWADNGDDRFSLVEDVQLENQSGAPITSTFNVTRDLPEIKG